MRAYEGVCESASVFITRYKNAMNKHNMSILNANVRCVNYKLHPSLPSTPTN